MWPSTRSACASACACDSLPFSTSFAVWRAVTSRAFSRPASTNFRSTSLSRTGTSADAITWAISPPITPAPTTAALNTNMAARLALSRLAAAELLLRRELDREARRRAPQRVAEPPAQQQLRQRRHPVLGLERHLERDLRLLQPGLEDHPPCTRELRVLELQRLAEPRLVADDSLARHPRA